MAKKVNETYIVAGSKPRNEHVFQTTISMRARTFPPRKGAFCEVDRRRVYLSLSLDAKKDSGQI